nr:DUF1132 family protein [Neisseria meningitidis]
MKTVDLTKIYKFEFCEIVDNCNFDDVFV